MAGASAESVTHFITSFFSLAAGVAFGSSFFSFAPLTAPAAAGPFPSFFSFAPLAAPAAAGPFPSTAAAGGPGADAEELEAVGLGAFGGSIGSCGCERVPNAEADDSKKNHN